MIWCYNIWNGSVCFQNTLYFGGDFMKNRRFGFLFRFVAAAIAAMLFVGTFSVTNAEAASRIPGNCRFVRWGSPDFSSFDIRWNPVKDCDGYQTCLSLTNGTKAQYSYFNYDVAYDDRNV